MNNRPPLARVSLGLAVLITSVLAQPAAGVAAEVHVKSPATTGGVAPEPQTPATLAPPAQQLEIVMKASRLEVTAGTGFGIWADIKNVSNQPIYLHPKFFTMVPPVELNRFDKPDDWFALLPGGQRRPNDDPY